MSASPLHNADVDSNQAADGSINLRLTKAEALVLSDWLHRIEVEDRSSLRLGIIDLAEERVLLDITACLERVLSEPFGSDYDEVINVARSEVRDKAD